MSSASPLCIKVLLRTQRRNIISNISNIKSKDIKDMMQNLKDKSKKVDMHGLPKRRLSGLDPSSPEFIPGTPSNSGRSSSSLSMRTPTPPTPVNTPFTPLQVSFNHISFPNLNQRNPFLYFTPSNPIIPVVITPPPSCGSLTPTQYNRPPLQSQKFLKVPLPVQSKEINFQCKNVIKDTQKTKKKLELKKVTIDYHRMMEKLINENDQWNNFIGKTEVVDTDFGMYRPPPPINGTKYIKSMSEVYIV